MELYTAESSILGFTKLGSQPSTSIAQTGLKSGLANLCKKVWHRLVKGTARKASKADVARLLRLISVLWGEFTFSTYNALNVAIDPKWALRKGQKWRIYVKNEDPIKITARLAAENSPGDCAQIEVVSLPENGIVGERHGSLFLPFPYVVPGGRFTEMYAWDSFFITLGLLQDGKIRLAQNMVDNFIYCVEHYGFVPNGNRTYYLTRSQLPFLTKMVRDLYEHNQDRDWLARAVRACEKHYLHFASGSRVTSSTGLSRFWDDGPPGSAPPEADSHELDEDGRTVHERVIEYYKDNYETGIPDYGQLALRQSINVIAGKLSNLSTSDIHRMLDIKTGKLTAEYFDNDRAMRESGFDTSRRFGMFGAGVLALNTVCLNSLLYLMETDLADLHRMSDANDAAQVAQSWEAKAAWRKQTINDLCWDEEDGMYYDYDHIRKRRRKYVFGTTFLPLWVGLASPHQAKRIVANALPLLEVAGGLASSATREDDQWDMPYAWAPLQLFAVEGLRKYGHKHESDRLAVNFASMVLSVYLKTGEVSVLIPIVRFAC